jgi:hypothetical protein
MPSTPTLEQVFSHIDSRGSPNAVAGAELSLRNGQSMTVQAGGSQAEEPPFAAYTVMLDHDPPRFWRRFGDDDQLTYLQVPRLLVTHHVIRHGGAQDILLVFAPKSVLAPLRTIEEVRVMLGEFLGRSISPGVLH